MRQRIWKQEGRKEWRCVLALFGVHLSAMVNFNNFDAAGDIQCRPIDPHATSDVHPLVQRVDISEVDKVEIGSRSGHVEGELGVI